MNNDKVLDSIQSKYNEITSHFKTPEYRPFDTNQLKFDFESNSIILNNIAFNKNALLKLCSKILVLPKFFKSVYGEYDREIWESTFKNLTKINTAKFYAVVDNNNEIVDIKESKELNSPINVDLIMNIILDELSSSSNNFIYQNMEFIDSDKIFHLKLLNESSNIKILNDYENDSWSTGVSIKFNEVEIRKSPFFLRKICTNGALAANYLQVESISRKNFNGDTIRNLFHKTMNANNSLIDEYLNDRLSHMNGVNVSLHEFYDVRNLFINDNNDARDIDILNKYFNDSLFYEVYNSNIQDQPKKWLSTANSGINAYDFLNQMTYLSSHSDKSNISNISKEKLDVSISKFICKEVYDLDNIAQLKTFEYPKTDAMEFRI